MRVRIPIAVAALCAAFTSARPRGDFRTLGGWLGQHVYRHARRYTAAQIVERATGSAPDPAALITSLSARYAPSARSGRQP